MAVRGTARLTKADVARLAKVSTASVSYVLNNVEGQRISAHTRAVVRSAAQQLGYRPNLAARNLASGGSGVVLYVVPRMALRELPIEELLRFEPPAPHVARYVTRDVTVHGQTVPEGAVMKILIGAAMRDHRQFPPDGDVFDIHREERQHLTFSVGTHYGWVRRWTGWTAGSHWRRS